MKKPIRIVFIVIGAVAFALCLWEIGSLVIENQDLRVENEFQTVHIDTADTLAKCQKKQIAIKNREINNLFAKLRSHIPLMEDCLSCFTDILVILDENKDPRQILKYLKSMIPTFTGLQSKLDQALTPATTAGGTPEPGQTPGPATDKNREVLE